MSTRTERTAIAKLAAAAWHDLTAILAERGESWPDRTDPTQWGPGAQGAMAEARAYAACLAIIEGRTPLSQLERVEELHTSSCPRCQAREEMSESEARAVFGDMLTL
ncbi:hypothetical protein J0910_29880 [Nocardiopsis sp. CNT-189]|uniref:hypothetical protein n=1 Tax=Nocardiopsis oceanisediminis TaxID=2816862 RepID=UPI003B2CDAC8